MNTVLLVGTADTKSDELAFLREQVALAMQMRVRLSVSSRVRAA